MNRLLVLISLFCLANITIGQDEIWMHPNRGQWHENIQYKIGIPSGNLYLEKSGFTYDFNNQRELYDHAHEHDDHDHGSDEFEGHVVKTTFLGAHSNPMFEELNPADFYENYFLSNDSSKWAQKVYPVNQVNYLNLYNGINLEFYESLNSLKYDILVSPGADPYQFKVNYEGQNKISITDNGELWVATNLGTLVERKPFAYQVINGIKHEVACLFVLNETVMSFEFPEGYDQSLPLVIDPQLAFSTFTGATSDNWGMTACPDVNKNLIAGGIVFGSGYPTSTGAYSASFAGGTTDIAITKFNATGSNYIYSTFIGGSQGDTPHSIIVNDQNELYILGTTSSSDFPTTGSAYDQSFNGGSSTAANGITYSNGADIFIFKLNSSGTTNQGCTFYGGSANDGINSGSAVQFNYGDDLRGEITVDANSNVYITTTTKSSDIPIVGGFDATLSGSQDAVVAKFNSGLSSLLWSTYLGGSNYESGNSVQIASNGDILVAGGTISTDFPNTAGRLNSGFLGGSADGYVTKFPAPGYGNPVSTYVGTNDYDQAYFVQLDIDDFVYLYGQTRGSYTISSGVYNNSNSGQFIHKISNDLTTSEWSSTFGASSGNEELSPTAFLVSDCYEIYVAGWGGNTNTGSAPNSSSSGMPISTDAYQSTTSGSNFYLGVFSADMGDLKYGTYMGDPSSAGDHVDGGTSRFDKAGNIYHAVCAACASSGGVFPTTSGVYGPNNNSTNCNMAAFVFELSKIDATLSTPSPVVCIPDPVDFQNDSQNGNSYLWDFGDGSPTSTDFEPSHFYANPGIYTVTLIVSDDAGCYTPDTAYIDVEIQLFEPIAGALSDTICPGSSVELYVIGGDTYLWGPPNLLDNPSSSNPIATITEETTFTVDITSVCGVNQVDVTVYVYGTNANAGLDTAICVGGSAQLSATGGDTYVWTPAGSLDDPNSATPIATPSTTTYYYVDITTPEGCLITDTTKVHVDQDIPYPNLADLVHVCYGESIQIAAGGATSYLWSPDYNISSTTVYNPYVSPLVDTSYAVTFTNACGSSYDTVDVDVIEIFGTISPDTTICPEGTAVLSATGGVSYLWSPSLHLSDKNDSITNANPHSDTQYSVLIIDEYGCEQTLYTNVFLYDTPQIIVSPAVYAVAGDTTSIWAQANGSIEWSPVYNIGCIMCDQTTVWPEQEYIYTATVTDDNGCKNSGIVPIYLDPLLYIPNTFTPNGDRFNNTFFAQGVNILEFEMLIFNRWGELIKTMSSLEDSWDGSYNGSMVKDDVYIWQVRYVDLKEDVHTLRGHVTVLK